MTLDGHGHAAAFVAAAGLAGEVLAAPAVGQAWDQPSTLAQMTVGDVAGHVFLVVRRVGKHLDAAEATTPPDVGLRPWSLSARVERPADLDIEVHRRVRLDGQHVAAWGWTDVATAYAERLARVASLLARGAPAVLSLGGAAVAFDEYLATRVVELLAHADDLAVSAGLPPPDPPAIAMDVALGFLVDASRRVHGDRAVFLAFTRRERVSPGVPSVY